MISVVIPTFNRSELLSRSVKSVIAQTYKDWELIVVDDGSTDDTDTVMREFTRSDRRIRFLAAPHSGSPPKVRNIGVRESTGEFIAFLDSDDEWLPDKLEQQLALIAPSKGKTALITCDSIIRTKNSDSIYANPTSGNHLDQILWGPLISIGSTLLIRASVIRQFGGFDETLGLVEDWDLPFRILQAGHHAEIVHKPLAICYVHENNITRMDFEHPEVFKTRKKYLALFLEKHHEIFIRNPKPFSFHLLRLGTFEYLCGEREKGRRHFIEALRVNPANLRAYASLGASLLGIKNFYRLLRLVRKVSPGSLSKMLKYYRPD